MQNSSQLHALAAWLLLKQLPSPTGSKGRSGNLTVVTRRCTKLINQAYDGECGDNCVKQEHIIRLQKTALMQMFLPSRRLPAVPTCSERIIIAMTIITDMHHGIGPLRRSWRRCDNFKMNLKNRMWGLGVDWSGSEWQVSSYYRHGQWIIGLHKRPGASWPD